MPITLAPAGRRRSAASVGELLAAGDSPLAAVLESLHGITSGMSDLTETLRSSSRSAPTR